MHRTHGGVRCKLGTSTLGVFMKQALRMHKTVAKTPAATWMQFGFEFAATLRQVRMRRGVSQRALAEMTGLSRTQISNLERNENSANKSGDPQLSTVYRLAWALEVPPRLLLPGCENHAARASEIAQLPALSQETVEEKRTSESYGFLNRLV